MSEAADVVAHGTSRTEGSTQTLHFVLHLPHPVERVWTSLVRPDELRGWLAAAEVLEPRLGGAVTLRWLNNETDPVHTGHVTAWDVERIVEYTIDLHGRCRFHLEHAAPDTPSSVLRFTNEFEGDDSLRLDCLAGWHDHFEYLAEELDGRPKDWSTWTPGRWQELRESYVKG
ncbi:SRPBCC domain-containing protein [Streptomyces sp. NPDC050418]|uniref:SRPBCC domain-containing protein n=1 Tax=Streptomyces sp. NPDC050418 TaxID=3365612 RepID=UPI0037A08571